MRRLRRRRRFRFWASARSITRMSASWLSFGPGTIPTIRDRMIFVQTYNPWGEGRQPEFVKDAP